MGRDGESVDVVADQIDGLLLGDLGLRSVLDLVAQQAKLVVPGTSEVGIMRVLGNEIRSDATTSELIQRLDEFQLKNGDGPCVYSALQGEVVECPDLERENRFAQYGAEAARSGVRSTLSMPLLVEDRPVGSLNMHSVEVSAFTEESQDVARGLSETAAIVLAGVEALYEQAQLAEQLRTALETRDVIGTAKGIVMERERVNRDEAFEMLVRLSQSENMKLREIAEQLVRSLEAN